MIGIPFEYSEDLKSDHSKSRLFEDQISNCRVFKGSGYSYGTKHFENQTIRNLAIFISILNVFSYKIVVICLDFKG